MWIGLASYVAVVALSVAGIAALRPRLDLVAILLAPVALVVLTSAAGYGSWRFRQPTEVSFVLLAGIGATWMTARRRHA